MQQSLEGIQVSPVSAAQRRSSSLRPPPPVLRAAASAQFQFAEPHNSILLILFVERQLMVLGLSLGLIGVVTFLHIIGKIVG